MIEAEQTKLIKLIDETRNQIKAKTRELLTLQPNLSDMDPYTVKLLLAENEKKRQKTIGEVDSDEE